MGIKGDKMQKDSVSVAEQLVDKWSSLGEVTSKRMFGGHGIFHEDKMLGMVDSKGNAFLKVKDEVDPEWIAKGSTKHGKMPYYSIPPSILDEDKKLKDWANTAIEASK